MMRFDFTAHVRRHPAYGMARVVAALMVMPGFAASGFGAATVDLTAGLGERVIVNAAGLPLEDGHAVWLGCFVEGFDPAEHADDPAALAAAWTRFSGTEVRTILDQAGSFAVSAASPDSAFSGRKPYVWILRTADGGEPEEGYENVLEHGLFSGADWTFADPTAFPPPATIFSSNTIDEAVFGEITGETLQLAPVPQGHRLSVWTSAFFPGQSDPDVVGPDADPDGDGFANLFEYLFGTDPMTADEPPTTIARDGEPPVFSLTVTIRKDRPDVVFTIEATVILDIWSPDGVTLETEAEDDTTRTIRASVPATSAMRFLRLRVDTP